MYLSVYASEKIVCSSVIFQQAKIIFIANRDFELNFLENLTAYFNHDKIVNHISDSTLLSTAWKKGIQFH